METSEGQVSRDAATIYQEFFVPALFGEWAPRMADALEPFGAGRVLDVACGTGVLARELARRVPAARVCGVDRNQGMLDVGKSLSPDLVWHCAHAEQLPFEDGTACAVGSQFGLMFFDDPQMALREMWRVLSPGGKLAVCVWGSLDATPGYRDMVDLLHGLLGESVATELRAPFRLGETSRLLELFARARIPEPSVQTLVGRARFPSLDAWVHTDVRGWTLAERIDDAQYGRLLHAARSALAHHVLAEGAVEFASPAHLVTAQKIG